MFKAKNFVEDVKIVTLWTFMVWLLAMIFTPSNVGFITAILIFMVLLFMSVRKAFAQRSYADNAQDLAKGK